MYSYRVFNYCCKINKLFHIRNVFSKLFFAKVKNSREIHMNEEELSEALWVKRKDISAQPDSLSLTNEMMWKFKNGEV